MTDGPRPARRRREGDTLPAVPSRMREKFVSSEASREDCGDVRCGCGALLAKLTAEGVELKCKRCKRVRIIPLQR